MRESDRETSAVKQDAGRLAGTRGCQSAIAVTLYRRVADSRGRILEGEQCELFPVQQRLIVHRQGRNRREEIRMAIDLGRRMEMKGWGGRAQSSRADGKDRAGIFI
jgi:hypothetical protein